LYERVRQRVNSLDLDGPVGRAVIGALKRYPLGESSRSPIGVDAIVSRAINRGLNAVTIGVLDLQHISENYDVVSRYSMRQTDYEDAVYEPYKKWWSIEVLEDAVLLLEKYVAMDMAIMTGMRPVGPGL